MNNHKKNKYIDQSFKVLGVLFTMLGIFILGVLIYNIVVAGFSRINWTF